MTIYESIKERILKCVNLEKLDGNPNDARFTFINDIDTIRRQKLEECRIWYVGDSDELQNFYTNRELSGNAKEPIYNRNKPNYFWGISVEEQPVKKVHSGVPHAIVTTLCNAIGMPDITSGRYEKEIKRIIEKNDFTHKLCEEARPLTLVEGWGAWKPIITSYSPVIQFQYYEGKDVDFVVKSNQIIGIIYSDYYKYLGKDYVLIETRRIGKVDSKANPEQKVDASIIEYELYRLDKSDAVERVELDTIPELNELPKEGYCIEGLKQVLGVPTKYFFDLFNKDKGRSIFTGKIDVFDDIDQCLSQASQTDRVSTPVEYYPIDMLERDKFGNTQLPAVYNRQFIKKEVMPNGEGSSDDKIQSTQPQLNFEQYINRYHSLIDIALIGVLSPASMGFEVSKKDNAEAQREKEKVTIFTRNNIIDCETKELKELFKVALIMQEYKDTGSVSLNNDYGDITVQYSEFASPTFENMSAVLLPLFNSGAISTREYVNRLYGDGKSDEEKEIEIAELEKLKAQDNMQFGDIPTDENTDIPNENNDLGTENEKVE